MCTSWLEKDTSVCFMQTFKLKNVYSLCQNATKLVQLGIEFHVFHPPVACWASAWKICMCMHILPVQLAWSQRDTVNSNFESHYRKQTAEVLFCWRQNIHDQSMVNSQDLHSLRIFPRGLASIYVAFIYVASIYVAIYIEVWPLYIWPFICAPMS